MPAAKRIEAGVLLIRKREVILVITASLPKKDPQNSSTASGWVRL
jgi:hypothetical protein